MPQIYRMACLEQPVMFYKPRCLSIQLELDSD